MDVRDNDKKPVRKRNPIAAFFIGIFRWVFGLICCPEKTPRWL